MSDSGPTFSVTLGESPTSDGIVAEVWVDAVQLADGVRGVQLAEVRREGATLRITIWGPPPGESVEWEFSYDEFLSVLKRAAAALGGDQG